MVAGKDAPSFGEAKNSWLTGTAAWSFLSISQAILGVKPALDGLEIAPCVPSGCKDYTVTRAFRGAEYEIRVHNPAGVQHGVKEMRVNGAPFAGKVIPVQAPGTHVRVEILMG